jgi:hypothetical protein
MVQTQLVSSLSSPAGELLTALESFDPSQVPGPTAKHIVKLLARVEKAAAAMRARAAARVAECGAFRGDGSATVEEWLAKTTGASRGQARVEIDTATAAEALPELKDALLAGRLSTGQAAEVAKTAAVDPSSLPDMLAAASTSTLRQLKEQGRRRRHRLEDPDELHARQHRLREFSHWVDDDGMVAGRFRLPPEVGTPLVTRLEREADRLYRAAPKEQRHSDTHSAFLADALVACLRGQAKGGPGGTDLVLVVDYDRYTGASDEGRCHIPGVGPVPVDLARRLGADAFLKGVVVDGSDVTRVRHFGRHIPTVVRTALELGTAPALDGATCSTGPCDRRNGLEWDHLNPIANHGPTELKNLDGKCRTHHDEKTEQDRRAGKLRRGPP